MRNKLHTNASFKKKSQVHTAQLNANQTKPETHCDYLSFQTWKIHGCVSKWERPRIMLAEIKTEAARHRTVALFSESPAWNPALSFLHLSLSSLSSLAHCSLSPCLWCTYVVTFHRLLSSLFLHSSLAVLSPGSKQQRLLRVLVMCAAQLDRAFLFCLFTLTKD